MADVDTEAAEVWRALTRVQQRRLLRRAEQWTASRERQATSRVLLRRGLISDRGIAVTDLGKRVAAYGRSLGGAR